MKAAKPKRITATQASKNFSDIVNRVRYRGEEFIVERNGEPVCRIGPVEPAPRKMTLAEFSRLLQEAPKPDPKFWDDVEAIIENQPPLPPSPWRS